MYNVPTTMLSPKNSLHQVLDLLNTRDTLTYKDICTALGITERQARRLVAELRALDVPVKERRQGRIKHFYLDGKDQHVTEGSLHLTSQEALALSVAAGAARAMLNSTPLQLPLASGFQSLTAYLSPQIDWIDLDHQHDRWYFGAIANNKIKDAVFTTLLEGLENNQSVWIDYDKPGASLDIQRKVDPHCFAVIGNAVMLAAYCHRKQSLRDFSLSRIQQAQLCDDARPYFDRRPDFDPHAYYASQRFGAMAGGNVQVFRIRVEPDRAHLFYERDYHPSQDIEHTYDDGSILVSFEVASFEEMRSFVQGWGVGVTVLEPPALVERVRQEAEELARRYRA